MEEEQWVVATEDYSGESEEELSLTNGQKYVVLEKDDTGWWFCRSVDGKEGWVPFKSFAENTEAIEKTKQTS